MLNFKSFLKMKRLLILTILAVFTLAGCSNYRNIRINDVDVKSFDISSSAEIEALFDVEVDNPSKTEFVVKDIECGIKYKGSPFADVVFGKPVVVPAASAGDIEVSCKVVILDPIKALSVGLNFKNIDMKNFTVDCSGTVKGGMAKKRFEFKDIPASTIIDRIK